MMVYQQDNDSSAIAGCDNNPYGVKRDLGSFTPFT
jgi:hypothetical protein